MVTYRMDKISLIVTDRTMRDALGEAISSLESLNIHSMTHEEVTAYSRALGNIKFAFDSLGERPYVIDRDSVEVPDELKATIS